MTVNVQITEVQELKPRIIVFGIGGAGGNAVNNMIESGLVGCDFVVANTDAQVLASSKTDRIVQMGATVTEGLGAGSRPEVGMAAAEEVIDEINDYLSGAHMVFITAGMGGGTGTGAAPVIARAAREQGILTVGVVTKPFQFEGGRRMRVAEEGIRELQNSVDTLIVIPNQNLFRIANAQTTFAEAFKTADEVLKSGVACITDLMVKEGLINLDFADVRSVMRDMGKAMMGTGESSTDKRATDAAEIAIANPLLDETTMKGARGLLISITGGSDLTLFEVDEAATRIRDEVDPEANVILGATYDESMDGYIRVSVVATGIDSAVQSEHGDDFQDDSGQSRWPLGSGATVVPLQNVAARPSTPRAAWETDRAAEPVPATTDPDVQIRTYRARNSLTNSDSSVNMGNTSDPLAMSDMDRHGKQIVQGEAEIQQGYRAPAHEGYVPPAPKQMPDASLRVSQSFFDPSAQVSQLDKTDDDRRPRGLLKRITDNLQRQNFAGEYADGEPVDSRERRENSAINRPAINRPAVNSPAIAESVSQATVPAPGHRDGQPERSRPNHSVRSDIPAQSGMSGMVEDTVESSRPSGGQLNLQPRAMDNFDDDQLEIPAFLRRENG